MRRIVIVGGGYAGFYTAWKLEKQLSPHEAEPPPTITILRMSWCSFRSLHPLRPDRAPRCDSACNPGS